MDYCLWNCRHCLRLSGWTWVITFPEHQLWCMDYCSLSLLNHTCCHLLQHSIFLPHYIKEIKEKGNWFKYKRRNTKTISLLQDRMIPIKRCVDVIHHFSHLIRANECKNIQFINGARKVEVLILFAEYLSLARGSSGICMMFGSSCKILQRCNEILSCS